MRTENIALKLMFSLVNIS